MPADLAPMLAVSSGLPVEDGRWAYEYKWDGIRAIAYYDGRQLRLRSRNNLDITTQYPELQALGPALGERSVILDGEIVALDDLDRPSFTKLQKRMKVTHAPTALALSRDNPVWFMIFDLLYVDGRSVVRKPLSKRRTLLEELTVEGPNWQVSPLYFGNGEELLESARSTELEGIVAKRIDSPYEPGVRSPNWRKIKIVLRQEFVIGGWTDERNGGGGIGALQLGYYDCDGKLRFAGPVGSGFTHATDRMLVKLLAQHASDSSPFADRIPKRGIHWVKPKLIAEVEFRRWPDGGLLQQAAFKGLRNDKDPRDVVREFRACIPNRPVAATPASPSRRRRDASNDLTPAPPLRGDAGVATTKRRGATS